MLSSKANAALARLKEIEEKYKMKRREQKWKEDTDSSISSVSIVPSESPLAESKKPTRLKLDIKMPDTRFEGRMEDTKLSSRSERSTSDKANAFRSSKDAVEIDLHVATPLDDKSPRFAGKQESLVSDIVTIQEDSLIESVLDDSVTPSKSLSRSKTSRRNSASSASDRSSGGREERPRTATRSEGGRESVKSFEISRGKASSDNSSKRLRLSGKSNDKISRVRLDLKNRSLEDKASTNTCLKDVGSKVLDNTNESGSLRDDSVVEESIGTMENGSEIISELSSEENSARIEASVLAGSKCLTDENTASNSLKGLMSENGYANDTFEDISSSTIRSERQSEEMINNGKKETIDGTRSNVKKIDIAEYRTYQDSTEKHRDELVSFDSTPKASATKVDPGSSNYVSDYEGIVANPDNVTVRSIKLLQAADSSSENRRKRYQRQKASVRDENVLSVASSNKNASDSSGSSESSTGDVTKTSEKNFPRVTTVRKECREASNRAKECAMIDVLKLPVNGEDCIKAAKSNSLLEEKRGEKGREHVSEESLDQRISQDVEHVLRKLHKGALAKKHVSSKITIKLESSSDNKIISEVQNTSKTRKVMMGEENKSRSSKRNKASNRCERDTKKKKKMRIMNSTSVRDARSQKKDKAWRFDEKQTRGLRKQIAELRLRQEREDLQKYLHELKDLRLESGTTPSYFKPLEFPKIAEFTQPDNLESSRPDDQFRERVLTIRRWLKDQYVLYRDYCTIAQAINAHYVPTTLDDTKKTIGELRKTTIKTR